MDIPTIKYKRFITTNSMNRIRDNRQYKLGRIGFRYDNVSRFDGRFIGCELYYTRGYKMIVATAKLWIIELCIMYSWSK